VTGFKNPLRCSIDNESMRVCAIVKGDWNEGHLPLGWEIEWHATSKVRSVSGGGRTEQEAIEALVTRLTSSILATDAVVTHYRCRFGALVPEDLDRAAVVEAEDRAKYPELKTAWERYEEFNRPFL
jgi:hypothetical protein